MTSPTATSTHGTTLPWVTGLLTTLLIVLQFCSPGVFDQLVYSRDAIASGEIWRLASGHLTHLDWNHLAMNAAALLGFGYLIETDGHVGRRNLLIVLAASAAAISTALFVFAPATALYAGLSGVLNGLFAYVCLRFFACTRSWIWLALFGGGLAKIAFEVTFGPAFSGSLAWPPEPLAHFAGLLGGVAAVAVQIWNKARSSWYFPWACPFISQ